MKYIHMVDLHSHSDNSHDGKHNVTLMCEYAIRNGLRALAVTDHCECMPEPFKRHNTELTLRQSFFETCKAKSIFSGNLLVLAGVEVGTPLSNTEAAARVLDKQYDIVLGSVHRFDAAPDGFMKMAPDTDPLPALKAYFDEVCRMAESGLVDVIAHLLYPLRYIKCDVNIADYYSQIDCLFHLMAERDIAYEVNTSHLTKYADRKLPEADMLKRFRAAGGRYVTVGSDAHSAHDVGSGVEVGLDLLDSCGFDRVSVYIDRVPLEIDYR